MTPPLIIFKRKRMPNQFETFLPQGWHANKSESGWMNSEIFFDFISKVFLPWVLNNSIQTPIILFVDGHVSHKSLKLSEFCLKEKIILVSFLPNCTHLCQAMDVVMYRPMKLKWASVIYDYKVNNPNKEKITRQDFCKLLKTCLDACMRPELLKTSFAATATYPFGAEFFDYTKLSSQEELEERSEIDDVIPINEMYPSQFVEKLEQLIEKVLPGGLDQFNRCNGQWSGDIESKHLYAVWQKAQTDMHESEVANFEAEELEGTLQFIHDPETENFDNDSRTEDST